MTFTKTIGGKDPWLMPSDGTDFLGGDPDTKCWERRQYHKAARREIALKLKTTDPDAV
jgi:hypothetical protein